jgi:hypothetical protein
LSDPNPSWLTRLVGWLLAWLRVRDAQTTADNAAIARNKEAAHDAAHAQADAPVDRDALARSVRDGDSF